MQFMPYLPVWGDLIAAWVKTEQDLHWLAPGTPPPLTGEKITSWKKSGGHSLVGFEKRGKFPVAYGELNPMRTDAAHLWIGHVVVDPQLRNCGIGREFVWGLLEEAFRKEKARRVSLVVFPENKPAVCCYQNCGFHIVGDESHRFQSGGLKYRLLRLEAEPSVLKVKGKSVGLTKTRT